MAFLALAALVVPVTSLIDLAAPIERWDEALPLGNGIIGALVWGSGDTLLISLDRGDLWDLRQPEVFRDKDFNYARMQRLVHDRNQSELHRLFDYAYDNIPYPTKLPAARLEIRLKGQLQRFRLDASTGIGWVELKGGESVRVSCLPNSPTVVIELPEPPLSVSIKRPAAEPKAGSNSLDSASLSALGYAAAKETKVDGFLGFEQPASLGFEYGVLARHRGSRIVATVANGQAKTLWFAKAKGALADALLAQETSAQPSRWQRLWSASSVTLPEPKLQRVYDLGKYFYGAASRPGYPPIPLQGLWTADSGSLPPWKGDYHNDLNTQTTYIGYQTAGLFDEGRAFLDFMFALLPRFQRFAREFYGVGGAVVPGVMDLAGNPLGGWGQYSLSPTNGAWIGQLFYRHWRYTMDARFLRERAWPFCRDLGTALKALLKPDASERLLLPLSTSPEIHDNSQRAWLKPNSNYDLALMRDLFQNLAAMGREVSPADGAEWSDLARRLGPYSLDAETRTLAFAEGEPVRGSHRHFSHLMAIHPLGLLDPDAGPASRKLALDSVRHMIAQGTSQWVGYSFAWMSCMLARLGQGDEALKFLRMFEEGFILRNGFHCNGDQSKKGYSNFTYRPFTLEGNFLAMEAVHEMMLQSHGGVVRVFPALPEEWTGVSFENLRAEGGFKVSAAVRGGKLVELSVLATENTELRLRSPLLAKNARLSKGGQTILGETTFAMNRGEVLRFLQ